MEFSTEDSMRDRTVADPHRILGTIDTQGNTAVLSWHRNLCYEESRLFITWVFSELLSGTASLRSAVKEARQER
jgi:hypothetical protein